jgi:hypothetical protein
MAFRPLRVSVQNFLFSVWTVPDSIDRRAIIPLDRSRERTDSALSTNVSGSLSRSGDVRDKLSSLLLKSLSSSLLRLGSAVSGRGIVGIDTAFCLSDDLTKPI